MEDKVQVMINKIAAEIALVVMVNRRLICKIEFKCKLMAKEDRATQGLAHSEKDYKSITTQNKNCRSQKES
jgi:hypothetical protein